MYWRATDQIFILSVKHSNARISFKGPCRNIVQLQNGYNSKYIGMAQLIETSLYNKIAEK